MIKEIPSADTNYVMWEAILNKFPEKTRMNWPTATTKRSSSTVTTSRSFWNSWGTSSRGFTVPPAHEKRSSDAKKRTFGEQPLSSVPPRGRFISNPQPNVVVGSGCVFCEKKNHRSTECKIYEGQEVRSIRARDLSLCYNCLKSDHRTATAPSRRSAPSKHHPALHGSKPARPPATTYHPSGYQGQGLQRQPNEEHSVAPLPRHITTLAATLTDAEQAEADRIDSISAGLHIAAENRSTTITSAPSSTSNASSKLEKPSQ
ncbi:hypothetical protein L596_000617 [Steinernema carpocapsae]|uniref:Uncharacterized protein n=1 Tax=Steinernema carpocapsae TaxID=34508 RepID=A0A4U8UJB9_STECR|nr:hypothetical protein L596_000617 [Steinernema carpocapsae]